MGYDCGSCVAKYALCIFNFVIFLTGTVVLAVGIWLVADKNSFIGLLRVVPSDEVQKFAQPAIIEQVSYVFIAIGAIIFVISFLGYCGALRESKCLLSTYGILLLIIVVLEICGISLAFAYRSKAEEETKKFLASTIHNYNTKTQDAITLMWDHLQSTLHCCGVNNYTDYAPVHWQNDKNVIPRSCCILEGDIANLRPVAPTCTQNPTPADAYHMTGCYKILMDWLENHFHIIIYVLVGLGILELLVIFLAFCLSKSLTDDIK